uniref:Minor capsid protein VP2 n=1 Tax=San Miguel sea lion virus serotype 4 TaxID=36407 RepID=VP2_SMSV4|nr:RecName: Full=Protein VP2; AltName: Full=Minor capsid protein [San Miguel sea lion virus 4]AAA16221.1 ORF [San Miguel sea lion virus]
MNYANFGLDFLNSVANAVVEGKKLDLASKGLQLKSRALDTERAFNYDRLAFEKHKFETNNDLKIYGDAMRISALRAAGLRINPYSNGRQIYQDEADLANLHSYYSFYKTD